VPLVVTGAEDGVVRWVNRRAAELFETKQTSMPGSSGPGYWVDPSDRLGLFDAVEKHGHVDGFVARLTTLSGRPFWALLSARSVRYQGDRCVMIGLADITAQKVAELAIRESEERIRHVFDAAPVALILSRAKDNLVLLANSVAARLFEVPLELVVGQSTPSYWIDTNERDRIALELVREGHADTLVTRLRTATGREFWGMLSARRIQYEGEVCFLVGVADVTAQKEAEEALRDQATRDALTGVPNRRKLVEIAEIEMSRARRSGRPLSVAMLDVDHFKRVNDDHGHPVGDQMLALLAEGSKHELRAADVLARVGGEEFAILFPDTDADGARAVAERLREHLASVSVTAPSGLEVTVTVSIGVAEIEEAEDFDTLLGRADAALYKAKHLGRNRVELAGP
jgi:diguanylate cyclase (GGDEF)-like protein/PAS domain S-box-containing protein